VRDDGYNVLEGGIIVGRIFLSHAAPQNRPWMWASGPGVAGNGIRKIRRR
jgi:hypothetical protein